MGLRINNNIAALNTHRFMAMNDTALAKSLEKLSSGMRVNRASDDAGGLSISETLRTQVRGLAQAEKNLQDGMGVINTAESSMNELSTVLQRMRELAVQSANGTLTASDRASIDTEYQTILNEVDRTTAQTTFNTLALFSTGAVTTFTLQVGANNTEILAITTPQLSSASVGGVAVTGTDITSQVNASAAIATLDLAINGLSLSRASLGAQANRLEHTVNSVTNTHENLSAAESRIRDVDMASEMSNMTRLQILQQSATAMLAQANAQPQSILSLFK